MNKVVLCVICLFVTAASAMAQAAPDAAELTKLLNDFLAGASRNDPAVHERFWADDLIYTRSAGRRVTKADIMRDLREAPAPKADDPKTVYTAENVRIQQYGTTAIVAFRLVATTEVNGAKQVQSLLNSGTFLQRNGKWQVVNWQSTRMPRTAEQDTRDVAAVVDAFNRALAEQDAKQLTAVTDRSFVWKHGEKEETQTQLIDSLKPGRPKDFKPLMLTQDVSLYGDTAVVRASDYTMTLVNQGGAWKAVLLFSPPSCTGR